MGIKCAKQTAEAKQAEKDASQCCPKDSVYFNDEPLKVCIFSKTFGAPNGVHQRRIFVSLCPIFFVF